MANTETMTNGMSKDTDEAPTEPEPTLGADQHDDVDEALDDNPEGALGPQDGMDDDDPDFDHHMPVFRAHWHIFLPTLVIALIYAFGWLFLIFLGMGGSALARLCVLVLALGVPLLAAHAFLRYQTIRIQALDDAVRYHPGWPKDIPVDLPAPLLERAVVRRGLAGRMFGGGTVKVLLKTGQHVSVSDLKRPDVAAGQINAMIERLEGVGLQTPPEAA